jgi:hypothetical protein
VKTAESNIPTRFEIVRNWERAARIGMYVAITAFGLLLITQHFWLGVFVVFLSMPAFWLFNLKCYQCAWPAYRLHGSAKARAAKDQLFAPMFSRQLWRLPKHCTKCGAPFVGTEQADA